MSVPRRPYGSSFSPGSGHLAEHFDRSDTHGDFDMKLTSLHLLGAVVVLVGMGMSYLVMARPRNLVESFGPFEIVTEQKTSHWRLFNPTGGMVERVDETTRFYRLRHRGKDWVYTTDDLVGREPRQYRYPQRVWVLPSDETAILVVIGRDQDSHWVLVREREGQVLNELVAEDRAHAYTGLWLDAPIPGRNDPPYGPQTLPLAAGRISGGRWLLLGDQVVFDAVTLQRHALGSHPELDFSRQAVLGMSPEHDALARYAERRDTDEGVVVVDRLTDGTAVTLPIDRQRMRYTEPEELDAEWLSRYFRWQGTSLTIRDDGRQEPAR